MISPDYIAWGVALWVAYLMLLLDRREPGQESEEGFDSTWTLAGALACAITLLVVTWPVTMALALFSETRRKP
jgi:hypothetical protein